MEQEELIKGKQIENTAATLINQPVTKIDDKDRQIAELKKQLEEQKK
ncbi:MAG: hypothetical protein IPP60_03695 [Sphingobacteriales bacterium]|nr:hypothetical protein [Sphingobacteriales bacterium]